jgi:hypothetical protein
MKNASSKDELKAIIEQAGIQPKAQDEEKAGVPSTVAE